jgi:diaminopimelate decarboxylase
MPVHRGLEGQLELGGVELATLAADEAIGTPSYVYDLTAMMAEAEALHAAWEGEPHLVAYAVKANSAGPVVRALAEAGCGADVVSGPELEVALACGIHPEQVLFSGVAKQDRELDLAIGAGTQGIAAIQVESIEELSRIAARARAVGRQAPISLRINPAVELETMGTHAHIATGHDDAKFGIPKGDLDAAFSALGAWPELSLVGLSTHVGSQFTSTKAYLEAARTLFEVTAAVRNERGMTLRFVDSGGGFGVDYGEGCAAKPADFVREALALKASHGLGDLPLHVEPGRALVAPHGVLLATVVQQKLTPQGSVKDARQRWLMIDAGMNDLLRPALYQARHRVVPLQVSATAAEVPWRVVGPVCESSDDFGVHPLGVEPPRLVALLDAGAYGYTMASRYNGRPLPAEVFVRDGRVVTVRARETPRAWAEDRYVLGLSPPLSDDARS